jgi:hypothetical protein
MLGADMTQAATDFLALLDAGQRERAAYQFNNEERYRWHWTTTSNIPRNGLPLQQMTE